MSTAVRDYGAVDEQRLRLMAVINDKSLSDAQKLKSKIDLVELCRPDLVAKCPLPTRAGNAVVDYALQLLREKPEIQPCTISTLITSICRAAMCGFKLGGLRPEAHIVPIPVRGMVNGEWQTIRVDANLWPGYFGWIKLVWRSGHLLADPIVTCVYEGEEFSGEIIDGALRCKHKGDLLNPHRRANDDKKITFVWARWKLDTGDVDVAMSRQELDDHAAQYSKKPKAYKGREASEWNWETKWREMAIKTVLIASVRRRAVPMSIEAGEFADEDAPQSAIPAISGAIDVVDAVDAESWTPGDDAPSDGAEQQTEESRTVEQAADSLDAIWAQFAGDLAACDAVPMVRRFQQEALRCPLAATEEGRARIETACNDRAKELMDGK